MGEIMNDDLTLLRDYARRNSEEAFTTLVSRYVKPGGRDPSHEALKQAMLDQLGLELVPAIRPVEMPVFEKAK